MKVFNLIWEGTKLISFSNHRFSKMTSKPKSVTPKASDVRKLADNKDRFGLFRALFRYTPIGSPRISDVRGFGPANVENVGFPATCGMRW